MKKYVLGITGVLACPCYLPLYLALLGGTTVGATLAAYRDWLYVAMTAYVVVAITVIVGVRGSRMHARTTTHEQMGQVADLPSRPLENRA